MTPGEQGCRRPFWIALLVITAAAIFAGVQAAVVLYAVVSPPEPPLPFPVVELAHSSQVYGLDEWTYASSKDACEILNFYRERADSCSIEPGWCAAAHEPAQESRNSIQQVARCTADVPFSLFLMRWVATLELGHGGELPAHLTLTRQISWSGMLPPLADP